MQTITLFTTAILIKSVITLVEFFYPVDICAYVHLRRKDKKCMKNADICNNSTICDWANINLCLSPCSGPDSVLRILSFKDN